MNRKLAIILVTVLWSQLPISHALGEGRTDESPVSMASIDGSFSLVDQRGHQITDEDFRGRYMLIYFGYTYCPDICPMGLQAMSAAIDSLGAAGQQVQPIFVTVDPERDTVAVMADYVDYFHPRLVGLTGSPEQVSAAAKAYGVRYFKLFPPPFQDDEESDEDENSRYLMNHSASTYLVGPDGRRLAVFESGISPREMAREIQRFIDGEA